MTLRRNRGKKKIKRQVSLKPTVFLSFKSNLCPGWCGSGLSAGLWTKGLLVQFPVRTHAWVVGWVPSRGCTRVNHTLMCRQCDSHSHTATNGRTETPNLRLRGKTILASSYYFMMFVFLSLQCAPPYARHWGTNMNKALPHPLGAYVLVVNQHMNNYRAVL